MGPCLCLSVFGEWLHFSVRYMLFEKQKPQLFPMKTQSHVLRWKPNSSEGQRKHPVDLPNPPMPQKEKALFPLHGVLKTLQLKGFPPLSVFLCSLPVSWLLVPPLHLGWLYLALGVKVTGNWTWVLWKNSTHSLLPGMSQKHFSSTILIFWDLFVYWANAH